jgi:hypothetical protein
MLYGRDKERKKNERKKSLERSKEMKEKIQRGRYVNKAQSNSMRRDHLEKLIASKLTKNKMKINGKDKEKKVEKEKRRERMQFSHKWQRLPITTSLT